MTKRATAQRNLILPVTAGLARKLMHDRSEVWYRGVREVWAALKRSSSQAITIVDLYQLPGVADTKVAGYVDDPHRLLLAALCQSLHSSTFFEFGTHRGRTSWTVAHNNPDLRVFTLDLPDAAARHSTTFEVTDENLFERWERGDAIRDTPEATRITQLQGDSASFDFSPYHGAIDFVYIDASHSYDAVKRDSEAALAMLSDRGVIAWDDYPNYAGIYSYLHELARSLPQPLYHVFGTRMVLYSARPLLAHSLAKGRPLPVSAWPSAAVDHAAPKQAVGEPTDGRSADDAPQPVHREAT